MKFQIPATAIAITLAAITAHCEEMPDTLMLTHNPANSNHRKKQRLHCNSNQ